MSEYERELLAKKLEKTKISSKSNLAASEKEEDMVIVGSEDSSPIEKGWLVVETETTVQ